MGEAKVPNGMALWKLHHAAFDADLLGVSPDLIVKVRRDLREEVHSPLLGHGLKDFHEARLRIVPQASAGRPDRALLAVPYERFHRTAG